VTDTPTRITAADVLLPDAITHPFRGSWEGWQFQGRDADGEVYVIDMRPSARAFRHDPVSALSFGAPNLGVSRPPRPTSTSAPKTIVPGTVWAACHDRGRDDTSFIGGVG